MGKRGPKPQNGKNKPTVKGYIRRYDVISKRQRMEHDIVWESHHGPIPKGYQVHHDNHIKTDNRIENLRLVDTLTHKRIHAGCYLVDGKWIKPCRKCGQHKPIDTEYYKRKDGISPWCRACCIDNANVNKRKRNERVK